MNRKDNYAVQAAMARQRFLTYDQQALIRKCALEADSQWLFTRFLAWPYRLHRITGTMERKRSGCWEPANSYEETMTLLDLICDSREDRYVSGRWKNMRDFGLMFHQPLLENTRDPWAQLFQDRPEDFRRACLTLGGIPMDHGDIAYEIPLFENLSIGLQLWLGDEEFPPNLRILWDENALMYLRYETMYFARGFLLQSIREAMEKSPGDRK